MVLQSTKEFAEHFFRSRFDESARANLSDEQIRNLITVNVYFESSTAVLIATDEKVTATCIHIHLLKWRPSVHRFSNWTHLSESERRYTWCVNWVANRDKPTMLFAYAHAISVQFLKYNSVTKFVYRRPKIVIELRWSCSTTCPMLADSSVSLYQYLCYYSSPLNIFRVETVFSKHFVCITVCLSRG